jgi:hypothetical protein
MDFEINFRPSLSEPVNLPYMRTEENLNAQIIIHSDIQISLYPFIRQKSIPKKQQNFLKNSTGNTIISAIVYPGFHRFSLHLIGFGVFRFSPELPSAGQSYCEMFGSSVNVSRAWWMISFWVATPFWVSSLHAQPVEPATPMIPLESKRDQSGVPLLQGGTYFICEYPATHGLEAARKPSSRLSTHAALVSTAHELHELPRIKKHISHKGTKAQRNTKGFIYKIFLVPWCLGGNIFDVHKYIFFSLHQGPKPAQGMIHTLSLAPLGFFRLFLIPSPAKSIKEPLL